MEDFFFHHWISHFISGFIGFLLGWFLRPNRVAGDLNMEGEARLRAENDELRAKLNRMEADYNAREADLSARGTEIDDLKGKLAATAAGAGAATVAAGAASAANDKDDEEAYALEWRNRYLAARVKYLEGRLADADSGSGSAKAVAAGAGAATLAAGAAATAKAKKKPATKKKPAAKKPVAKKAAPKKAVAKAKPKPKVLYTDGPTDGPPDDLKKIKGIGPKFEKDLNDKGIYYYRQIGSWKRADVKMVEGAIDSFPGRIDRDDWIPQAKQLAKSAPKAKAGTTVATKAATAKTRKKPGPKAGTKRGTTNKDGSARQKPGPKAKAAKDPVDRYYDKVKVYEIDAKRDVVANIVKYCGVSLRSRDTSLVACSDMKERERIATGFAAKKLGLNRTDADALIARTCTTMQGTRQKNRVVFYYLMARDAGKLDVFGG